jgi:hypothetical protein
MKKGNFVILILSLITLTTFAQSTETDAKLQSELKKLSFMEGKWEGNGWMIGRDGVRSEFTQTENIQFKLDNTLLYIEGLGKSDGKVVHDALAIISFDKEKGHYNFRSYLANGMSGDFMAELIDGKLYWHPTDFIRYIIYLNKNDQWHEKGEINRDGNWIQFFEMTLNKKQLIFVF